MALPSSGPLSLSDIQTEFGGSNPISLSEYYAGGTYVPPGTTGTNGAVPSSGAISINSFYGTSAATALSINISPGDMYTSRSGSGPVTSGTDTASGSGGSGGYTYVWSYQSGDLYTISSATTAATTFSTSVGAGVFKSGVYRCTVTDSLSATAYQDVTIEFEAV